MKVILMYSGKGGVGKTTMAVNFGFFLHKKGFRVGICDSDINSPSIASFIRNLPKERKLQISRSLVFIPALCEGVKITSTGLTKYYDNNFIINDDYIKGTLHQILFGVDWDVDYLIIDLPPGFSNLHSQISHFYNKAALFLVTDSKYISYKDSLFGIKAFRILGIETKLIIDNFYKEKIKDTEEIRKNNFAANIPYFTNLKKEEIDRLNNKGIPYVLKNNDIDPFFESLLNETI